MAGFSRETYTSISPRPTGKVLYNEILRGIDIIEELDYWLGTLIVSASKNKQLRLIKRPINSGHSNVDAAIQLIDPYKASTITLSPDQLDAAEAKAWEMYWQLRGQVTDLAKYVDETIRTRRTSVEQVSFSPAWYDAKRSIAEVRYHLEGSMYVGNMSVFA